jgi:hypothetical protein
MNSSTASLMWIRQTLTQARLQACSLANLDQGWVCSSVSTNTHTSFARSANSPRANTTPGLPETNFTIVGTCDQNDRHGQEQDACHYPMCDPGPLHALPCFHITSWSDPSSVRLALSEPQHWMISGLSKVGLSNSDCDWMDMILAGRGPHTMGR